MFNVILIIVGSLVGLIVLMALIGLALPKEHVASSRISLGQKPEAVWDVLIAWEAWPTWHTAIRKMERRGESNDRPVWVMHSSHGELPLAIEEESPPRRIVTRIIADRLPFGGRWIYEIEGSGGGCTVTITEEGEVYNPLFRFLAKTVFGYHKTLEDVLKALAARFGETPAIERLK